MVRDALQNEFDRRRANNPRYSLRAFARFIGTDHATLSQILRGTRRLTPAMIRRLGARLQMSPAGVETECAAANDALVLAVIDRVAFRPDSRWIATMTGLTIDEVNVSLQRLLYKRAMVMLAQNEWRSNEQ